jgi:hypothetical protein
MLRVLEALLLAISTVSAYLTVRDARGGRRDEGFERWMRESTGRIDQVAHAILAIGESRHDAHAFNVARLRYGYALGTALNPEMEFLVLLDLKDVPREDLTDEKLEEALHAVDEWLLNTPSRSAERYYMRRRRLFG